MWGNLEPKSMRLERLTILLLFCCYVGVRMLVVMDRNITQQWEVSILQMAL
jgi:hypothetical protein